MTNISFLPNAWSSVKGYIKAIGEKIINNQELSSYNVFDLWIANRVILSNEWKKIWYIFRI